jgi:hypothetical protein
MSEAPQGDVQVVSIRRTKIDARTAWSLIMVVLSCLLLSIGSMIYASHVSNASVKRAQDNTRQFCALMITLDSAYQAAPKLSSTGQLVAKEVHQLVKSLGCDGT